MKKIIKEKLKTSEKEKGTLDVGTNAVDCLNVGGDFDSKLVCSSSSEGAGANFGLKTG